MKSYLGTVHFNSLRLSRISALRALSASVPVSRQSSRRAVAGGHWLLLASLAAHHLLYSILRTQADSMSQTFWGSLQTWIFEWNCGAIGEVFRLKTDNSTVFNRINRYSEVYHIRLSLREAASGSSGVSIRLAASKAVGSVCRGAVAVWAMECALINSVTCASAFESVVFTASGRFGIVAGSLLESVLSLFLNIAAPLSKLALKL